MIGGKVVKKILIICSLILAASFVFAGFAVTGFAAPSPEATVYPPSESETQTKPQPQPATRPWEVVVTTTTSPYPGAVAGIGMGGIGAISDRYTPSFFNPAGAAARGGRTTRSSDGKYNNNQGKDNPDSPNYTGNRAVTSDKSSTSPNTSAQRTDFVILFPVFMMMLAAAVVVIRSKKAVKNS